MNNIQIGDKLVAKDPCKMNNNSGICALTVGREYAVKEVNGRELSVIDNQGDIHWYTFGAEDGVERYFHQPIHYFIY